MGCAPEPQTVTRLSYESRHYQMRVRGVQGYRVFIRAWPGTGNASTWPGGCGVFSDKHRHGRDWQQRSLSCESRHYQVRVNPCPEYEAKSWTTETRGGSRSFSFMHLHFYQSNFNVFACCILFQNQP